MLNVITFKLFQIIVYFVPTWLGSGVDVGGWDNSGVVIKRGCCNNVNAKFCSKVSERASAIFAKTAWMRPRSLWCVPCNFSLALNNLQVIHIADKHGRKYACRLTTTRTVAITQRCRFTRYLKFHFLTHTTSVDFQNKWSFWNLIFLNRLILSIRRPQFISDWALPTIKGFLLACALIWRREVVDKI